MRGEKRCSSHAACCSKLAVSMYREEMGLSIAEARSAGSRCRDMMRIGRWRAISTDSRNRSAGCTQYLVVCRAKSVGGFHAPSVAAAASVLFAVVLPLGGSRG